MSQSVFNSNHKQLPILMKTTIRNQALLLGATLLGALLFTGPNARAVDLLQVSNQVAGRNWIISPSWGVLPGALPNATTNYFTPAGFDVRTPDSLVASTFVGASLQIEPGGRFILKNGGAFAGIATGNVKLNGGSMNFNTSSGSTICAIGGTFQVLVPSIINSLAGANTRDIWLRSDVSGSGDLSVGMINTVNALVLFGTNSAYSGNWTVTSGRLEIGTNSLNALGSGTVTLANTASFLTFNTTNDLVVTNLIGGTGGLWKQNTNTVTLSGNNNFTGSTVVSNGVLKLNSATAISSSPLISLVGATVDASSIGGLVLNDTILQSMNSKGTVVGNLTATTGTTNVFTMTTTTNDILNVTGTLTLNGTPTIQVIIAGLKPSGTYRLINYTGAGILGGGAFGLVAPVSSQTFTLDVATPGQVNLIIVGDPKPVLWAGDGSGNAWDTTSLNWTNSPISLTNFNQGDFVTFNDSGSTVPDITVAEAVIPSTMTVSNTSLSYLFTGVFGISSSGTLTKAGANDLVFDNDGNTFTGPVDIRAGMLSIGNGTTTGSLGNPSSITNNGVFRVNKGVGGAGVTVNGPISGSGSVYVTGGAAILTLSGTNTYTGLTTVDNECQLLFTNSSGLGSAAAGTIVLANGRLGITTVVGAMTLAESLVLNGSGITTGNNLGGALYMTGVSNNITLTAPVTIASDARVRVLDNQGRLTFMNTVLATNGTAALRVSVGAQPADVTTLMTFSNTVWIGTGVLTKDGQGAASFTSVSNVAGSTIINEGSLLANGKFNGGPVTVNASGTVGGSGAILGAVAVGSVGTLAPGNAAIGTLTLSNTLTLAATAVTRMEINRTNLPLNADLLVAVSIPMNGTLTVVNTGPALQVGDTFNLFDGTMSGAFTATNLPALALLNHYWDTTQLGSLGIIAVASNTLPILPLVITDIVRNPTNVVLTWNSYPTRVYDVQYLTDLSTNNWTTLKANIPASSVTNSTTSVVDTSGSTSGLNNTLVQYQMGTADAQIQDATNTMAAGPLTPGALFLFNPNANVTLPYPTQPELQASPNNATTTLVDAVANSSWFTFELSVGTNVTDLDLTSLSFDGARGGGAAPRGYGAYVILPDLTEVQIQGSTAFNTQRPVWDPQFINLTGVAGLQNLTNGQVITFKIAIFSPQNANSLEFDDITVKGNITPRPVTPYENAGQVFYRIKQQ
jgi:autotransporter-associated beta strand protein